MTDLVDWRISTEWVNTEVVPRPQPDRPAPSCEYESVSDVPPEMDRWVGFSGGNDSLATTHYAMSNGLADGVVYCDTGSGLAENLSFVRRVCSRRGWPLVVVPPRDGYEKPLFRYEAPGPDLHSMWFHLAKGGGWRKLYSHIDGSLKIITGVYRGESDNRMKAITSEVQREVDNFRGWFISPFFDADDETLSSYLTKHDLPSNPCYANINRSGDCYCLAYAGRDEILELAAHYPEHFHWIMNVERRMQEYRGRIHLLRDRFEAVYQHADDLRTDDSPPYRLFHDVFADEMPNWHEMIADLPRRRAVLRGMQEHTCWLGHGDTSSDRLHAAANQADLSQTTLCGQSCNKRSAMGLSPEVQRNVETAEKMDHTQPSVIDY